MSPVVPAIIPTSLTNLEEILTAVSPFAREVQVDIVDGVFVPFVSWPYGEDDRISDIDAYTNDFLIEVDLMLMEPERVIEEYLKAGVRRAVVHLESTKNLDTILALKKKYDFKLGFSIGNDTSLEMLMDVIDDADYVQFMGIAKIGSQGQPFDERVLERISTLKKTHPNLLVSIDGSVNEETISRLAHAGADRVVAGSAILKAENPHKAFETLVSLYTISI